MVWLFWRILCPGQGDVQMLVRSVKLFELSSHVRPQLWFLCILVKHVLSTKGSQSFGHIYWYHLNYLFTVVNVANIDYFTTLIYTHPSLRHTVHFHGKKSSSQPLIILASMQTKMDMPRFFLRRADFQKICRFACLLSVELRLWVLYWAI